MANKKNSKRSHQLRIIAGKWRGQKINVIDQQDLRPTTDRVRETLFNWLALSIMNAECLDAFAGSGILSFEALSRDAKSVVSVEKSKHANQAIKRNAEHLNAQHMEHVELDVMSYLLKTEKNFDIIFLDPPFAHPELLTSVIKIILRRHLIKNNGLLYIEMAKSDLHLMDGFKSEFTWLKEKTAGQVCYALLSLNQ